MATKYVTKAELAAALKELHDDLKENHFEKVLDAINHLLHAEASDTREIKDRLGRLQEAIMTLSGSVDTLGTLVRKVVTDGATNAQMIADLKAEIERLIAQGSADSTELAALKAQVDAAVPAIDANNALLQTLDDSVQDPGNADLDPNAHV